MENVVLPAPWHISCRREHREMKKFVEYSKLSKKAQHEYNRAKRRDWNGVDPRTKIVESKKIYNRNDRTWMNEY